MRRERADKTYSEEGRDGGLALSDGSGLNGIADVLLGSDGGGILSSVVPEGLERTSLVIFSQRKSPKRELTIRAMGET